MAVVKSRSRKRKLCELTEQNDEAATQVNDDIVADDSAAVTPTSPGPTDAADRTHRTTASTERNGLLKLPRELLVEILSHIIPQGRTITMTAGKVAREQRRWQAEAARLQNPDAKRPRRSKALACVLACRELYISSVTTFYGGNTLSFATLASLQRFLDQATTIATQSVKRILLFRGHDVWDKTGLFASPTPSLRLLSALPRLRSLELSGSFMYISPHPPIHNSQQVDDPLDTLYGADTAEDPRHVRHTCSLSHAERAVPYTRDAVLKSIPSETLTRLSALTASLQDNDAPILFGHGGPVASTARHLDILPYARDLQAGAWEVLPHPTAAANPQHTYTNRLWLEARAAVYFARGLSEPRPWAGLRGAAYMDDRLYQWCTWSREWGAWQRKQEISQHAVLADQVKQGLVQLSTPLDPLPAPSRAAPRTFDELFEGYVAGELVVRDEYRWERYVQEHPEARESY